MTVQCAAVRIVVVVVRHGCRLLFGLLHHTGSFHGQPILLHRHVAQSVGADGSCAGTGVNLVVQKGGVGVRLFLLVVFGVPSWRCFSFLFCADGVLPKAARFPQRTGYYPHLKEEEED